MAETAADRIERILQVVPLAARDGGIAYDDLTRALGVDRARIEADLTEVMDREFYHEAGSITDIQVGLEADRVRVWTTGLLRRPLRLSPAEAAALDLGVRILAAEQDDPDVARRMHDLVQCVARTLPGDFLDRFAVDGDPGTADALRALIVDAARRRRAVRFSYLKPDADGPEDREIEPYAVAYGEGCWYVIGRCLHRDAVRAFRTDRILEAECGDAPFEPPADFDPADYLADGRVYHAEAETEVAVRYSGRVAPFLRERGEGEALEDGGVLVRHRVADPGWLVRHVLQYGRDARVLEPDGFVDLVRAAARRVRDAAATDDRG